MIPRPLTEGAARHNPGRWICNTRPEKCDGIFRVYGQDMPCPIRARCFWGRRNSYQWTPGSKECGRFPELDVDAGRKNRHNSRLKTLIQLFTPERRKIVMTPEQRERATARMREARRKKREAEGRPFVLEQRAVLPCGEDCKNCPYDACPYTDRDTDEFISNAAKERARQQSREKYRRQKAREAIDPEYAAKRKAQEAVRRKRYYEAHKEMLREKARERDKKKREEERMKKS